jgi:hypothetical protein
MKHPTLLTRCTATISNGEFCDAASMADAPFPICFKHAYSVFKLLDGSLNNVHAVLKPKPEAPTAKDERDARRKEAYAAQRQVYYIRIGDHIKIGFTQNMQERMLGLRVDLIDVLATEPGGRDVERERHKQFAHLRVGNRENFKKDPDLLTHIAKVRREHGKPRITGYITGE